MRISCCKFLRLGYVCLQANVNASAASAIAANTFLRSLAGAGFPLFARYMFDGMGIQWAGTLIGCVAVLLVPIPVGFYIYGARIRAKSKFAPTMPPQVQHNRADEESAGAPDMAEGDVEKTRSTATGVDAV